jgi:hypothetical protein
MGGTHTIGFLNQDGSVSYDYCYYELADMRMLVRLARLTPSTADFTVPSVSHYFSEDAFEEDDSSIRFLVLLDGTVLARIWGFPGEYTWRPSLSIF